MEILSVDQGSQEWLRARMGIPTASKFACIMADGEGRETYMHELLGERLSGQPTPQWSTAHSRRGHEWEPVAVALYELAFDVDTEVVGIVRNHGAGYSPDRFVGDVGLLEVKTALPKFLLKYLRDGTTGSKHYAQCQGGLWLTEREWCDLWVYWKGLPLFLERFYRDEKYITKLAKLVARFNDDMSEIHSAVLAVSKSGIIHAGQPLEVTHSTITPAQADAVVAGAVAKVQPVLDAIPRDLESADPIF